MSTVALRCEGLVHVYREADTDVAALRGIDLVVQEAERIALLGPSGSGKSTLMAIVAGILRPSAGRISVFGVDIERARERDLLRIRRDLLGLMLQGAATNLLLHEDAEANLAWALRGKPRADATLGRRILRSNGLGRDLRPVSALIPSEQQIVALAVSMAARPRLLIADEPTSQLDDASRDHLLDLFVDTAAAEGTAVLLVTHDEDVARRMQRMIHLRDGRIGEEASDEGRFAVIGTDGSVQLPTALRESWPAGALVDVDEVAAGEIRLRLRGGEGER
ncbi:ABC transporter ATP-binding protein [Frondihabitans peucedani]|uniref:ABC transporter ATP-binding protein n=1 Tax=Frondihabitans peucedani TaxID=598626 RepID=A0ABP8E1M9_9MICO